MKQLILILSSVLCVITVMGLRVAYTIDVQDWFLWGSTVAASWTCVFAIGYIVSAIQHGNAQTWTDGQQKWSEKHGRRS